jgi:hypothetical protein
MINNELEINIDLYYQYQMIVKNNKPRTPDFKIEVSTMNSPNEKRNIILDSKFKDFDISRNHSSIAKELLELIEEKDYSQNGKNSVFILHPSYNSIESSYTLQEWKYNSYYGGDMIFEWQTRSPQHNIGAVMLRPHYKKDLHRLLGMILQYLPITSNNYSNSSINQTQNNDFIDIDDIPF